MGTILKKLTGMDNMTHQVLATDLLMGTKSCIKNYSIAITETTTPEIRTVMRNQLNDAILQHERLTEYMIKNEYYHPNNLKEQIMVDTKTSETALNITRES